MAAAAPVDVSFPLPNAPHTNIQLQLRNNGPNLTLFLTTTTPDSASAAPLGSFVYAMPNARSPAEVLSTPLYTQGATLDFATRLSKVLARRTNKPVYVGSSATFANAGMGGTVEEEMAAFRRIVEVVMRLLSAEKASDK
jgi:hypothetical protein